MYDDMEDLLPTNKNKAKNRKLSILNEIKDIEDTAPVNSTFLPSSLLKDNKSSKHNDYSNDDVPVQKLEDTDVYEWFSALNAICAKPSKKKLKNPTDDIFESIGIKKKKKKKKKHGDNNLIDFKSEFDPERSLYKNLLIDQSKFVDSLQNEYDSIIGKKSSNRGLTKQMTDLIENIIQARSLSMQLVEKNVNVKKLIAELDMKQKKEFGITNSDNLNDFAATYMRNMINAKSQSLGEGYEGVVSDYDESQLLEAISSAETESRPEEVSKYLEYYDKDIKVYVVIDENDPNGIDNYTFIAKDNDDNIIEDYPMPIHTSMSINRSTNMAVDKYGQKYPIIWL